MKETPISHGNEPEKEDQDQTKQVILKSVSEKLNLAMNTILGEQQI